MAIIAQHSIDRNAASRKGGVEKAVSGSSVNWGSEQVVIRDCAPPQTPVRERAAQVRAVRVVEGAAPTRQHNSTALRGDPQRAFTEEPTEKPPGLTCAATAELQQAGVTGGQAQPLIFDLQAYDVSVVRNFLQFAFMHDLGPAELAVVVKALLLQHRPEQVLEHAVVRLAVEIQLPRFVQELFELLGQAYFNPSVPLHSTSTVTASFFYIMRSYFSFLLLAFRFCQGSAPLRKYIST